MTAREALGRRMQWLSGAMYAGGGVFFAAIVYAMATGDRPPLSVVLSGFGVMLVASMIAQYVALRCPRCSGNLGTLIMQCWRLAVDRRIRFCPFCGTGLDEALPAGPSAEEGHEG